MQLEYAAWEWWQDCVVVVVGGMSTTFVFGFMVLVSMTMRHYLRWYPKFWHKVLCWIGIFAVLDPVLTLLFDTLYMEW